jgi:hypothetical protein
VTAALSTRQHRLELRVSEYFKGDYNYAHRHWACAICTPFSLSLLCIVCIVVVCLHRGGGRAHEGAMFQRLKPALFDWRFVAAEVVVLLSIGIDIARWM